MAEDSSSYGFIGLGQMGAPMAANLAQALPQPLCAFDHSPTALQTRLPANALAAANLAALAGTADTLFLSVPDGRASLAIAQQLCDLTERTTRTVIDLSTTGISAAREIHALLAAAGIVYIDAPVSGGVAGAKAATITVIWAGPVALLTQHRAALEAISGNIFHVGDSPGQGQTVKLLNNFLSATALAATSEAVLFGLAQGVDAKTIIDVVNVSTGRNTASSDKFPKRILTETFDAGFYTALMRKDVQLYLDSAQRAGTPAALGAQVEQLWRQLDADRPGSDITEIFTWLSQQQSN